MLRAILSLSSTGCARIFFPACPPHASPRGMPSPRDPAEAARRTGQGSGIRRGTAPGGEPWYVNDVNRYLQSRSGPGRALIRHSAREAERFRSTPTPEWSRPRGNPGRTRTVQ